MSAHSKDPDATWGRISGGPGQGYTPHLFMAGDGTVIAWHVAPLNVDEREIAIILLEKAKCAGYMLADANDDTSRLHDVAIRFGGPRVSPRAHGRRGGHSTSQSPAVAESLISGTRTRDRLQRRVSRRHHDSRSVGIIDETSFVKKGTKTAGVQRQHCGAVGKTENCVVSVHLGYATPDFYTLLDGELFLPEVTWHEDRARCREAGIPDEVVYRSKWQIALAHFKRALSNGLRFAWLTFDEGGRKGEERVSGTIVCLLWASSRP